MRITQESELEWEFEDETSPQPVFRFTCAGGCHFGNEAQCRRILRTAIADAIGLASGAAVALEGDSKRPDCAVLSPHVRPPTESARAVGRWAQFGRDLGAAIPAGD